jgi:hypothetical protein
MGQRENTPSDAHNREPVRLPDFLPQCRREWLKRHIGREEKGGRRVDGAGRYAEIVGEAICLRVAEIASVQAVEQIDASAERHDKEVQLAVQCAVLGFFFGRNRDVATLVGRILRLLQLFGGSEIRGRQRMCALEMRDGHFLHLKSSATNQQVGEIDTT